METAPDEEEQLKFREMEELKSKCLYICTAELKEFFYSSWLIHEIKMSDVLSESEEFNPKILSYKVMVNEFGQFPVGVGCGVFKSKILFGGGTKKVEKSRIPVSRVLSFEPGTDSTYGKPKLEHFSNFFGGKAEPLLVEMQGKLYALAGDEFKFPCEQHFEVYDPSCGEWSPLTAPPFWDPESPFYRTSYGLAYVVTDTSILVSRVDTPVFRFNITEPDEGWRIQTSLCSGGPFPFRGRTVVDDCADGGFLIFSLEYEIGREGEYGRLPPTRLPTIPVYHMSNDYDSLIHIESVKLPDQLPLKFGAPETYSFVNLGGHRVCLALSTFSSPIDGSLADREKLSILVATFEYKVETSKKRTREASPISYSMSYKFLTTPGIIEYDIQHHPEVSPSPVTVIADMLGAFVL